MRIGHVAALCILVALPLMCAPRLYRIGMALFGLGLVLAALGVAVDGR